MKIVCFGDSLTSCGRENGRFSDILAERFPDAQVVNAGIGGNTWVDAVARIDEDVLALHPDIVLLEFGANDWWRRERTPQEWAGDLEYCIEKIQEAGAVAVVLGVFGTYHDHSSGKWVEKSYGADEISVEYRKLEADIASRHGCPYLSNIQSEIIDDRTCWGDRNHPNEHGNRMIVAQLVPIIEKLTGMKANEHARVRYMSTLQDFWEEAVLLAPERLAAVCGDRRLTYGEADSLCASLASGFVSATGKAMPTIAVCLPNCLEYFLIYWALVKLGGIIVPINPWLKTESLDTIIANVKPDAVILQNARATDLMASLQKFPDLPVFSIEETENCRIYSDLFAEKASDIIINKVLPEAPAIVMHTSGTTSAPKGAVMRNSDLIFNVMTTINAQGFVPSDIHLLINPMYHCTALYSSLPAAAYQKTPVIITAEMQPDRILPLIQQEHITTFLTVPSILQRIVSFPDIGKFDLSSLRVIGYAGSFMPVKTVLQLQQLFPEVELHNFFGMTETISATHVLNGQDSRERPASIGRTLPFVFARINDEEGRECPPGVPGELLFARENVIAEYWGKPGKLEESIVEYDGKLWFRTGDIAVKDEEGFYFIKGRKKDMIIVGGENVFAAEVEASLVQMDGIREAAVIGIPATGIRESLGEMIKAFIVVEKEASLTENDVRRYCHKALPSYKIPHVIQFLDALPRNPSGKIMKNELPR